VRTVDVARRAGCSIHQVRKLEAAGVLPPPPPPRTTSGYRQYHERHAASLLVYQQLAAAIGPVPGTPSPARCTPRRKRDAGTTRRGPRTVAPGTPRTRARQAGTAVHPQRADGRHSTGRLDVGRGTRPCPRRTTFRSAALGSRKTAQSTSKRNGSRSYSPVDVRDARLIHQLRQAGHRIGTIAGSAAHTSP